MVFLSCESAKDYSMGKNIVAACRAKGAACVVGFTAKIDTDSSTDWVERMFDYLSQGFSISYACHQALLDGDYDYDDNIWSYLPKGSANQPLFIFNLGNCEKEKISGSDDENSTLMRRHTVNPVHPG